MCHEHLNEVPNVVCSVCDDTFQCIHEKERHGCIPELGCVQKKLKSPIPKPRCSRQREVFTGNSYTGVRLVTGEINAIKSTCLVCNSYTSCPLKNLPMSRQSSEDKGTNTQTH